MGAGYKTNARGYRSVPKQALVDELRHHTRVVIVPERNSNNISSAAVVDYETAPTRPTEFDEGMTDHPVKNRWIPSRHHQQFTSDKKSFCYDGDVLLHRASHCPDGHWVQETNYRLLLCQKFPGGEAVEEVAVVNKDVNAGAVMRRIVWEYVRFGQRPDWNVPPPQT
jgi:hypothetical protein